MHLLSRVTFRNVQNVSKFGKKFGKRFGHSGTPEELDATAEKWKKIFLLMCVPSIVVCSIHCYFTEKEHLSHPRPEFKKYDYMYLRRKPFPWGDGNHGLFHNPVYNALPEGYEVPDPNEHKKHEHH